jgi:hypothetical protein
VYTSFSNFYVSLGFSRWASAALPCPIFFLLYMSILQVFLMKDATKLQTHPRAPGRDFEAGFLHLLPVK